MFTNVPKDFLTKVYLGEDNPTGQDYAMPCFCGEPFQDEDEIDIMMNQKGDIICCHTACVGDDDA